MGSALGDTARQEQDTARSAVKQQKQIAGDAAKSPVQIGGSVQGDASAEAKKP